MERSKTINRLQVRIRGTEYEINSTNGHPIYWGTCEEGVEPRQIYERHYPAPDNDGIIHENKTLFFISDDVFGFSRPVVIKKARLIPYEVTMTQEGYALMFMMPRQRSERIITWHDRPIIVMTKGCVEIPDTLLYDIEERGDTTIKKSKYLSHDLKQLDAIVEWLEANGRAWEYM